MNNIYISIMLEMKKTNDELDEDILSLIFILSGKQLVNNRQIFKVII